MQSKIHTVAITVRFDKPVSVTEAVRLIKDCIHGKFYPCPMDSASGAETMQVRKISKLHARKIGVPTGNPG